MDVPVRLAREIKNVEVYETKVESMFDPHAAGIDEVWWPTKEDFTGYWDDMTTEQKVVVAASIEAPRRWQSPWRGIHNQFSISKRILVRHERYSF